MDLSSKRASGFNIFGFSDEVTISRIGKQVTVKGRDGTFNQTDTVEANLLFEILKTLKKSK